MCRCWRVTASEQPGHWLQTGTVRERGEAPLLFISNYSWENTANLVCTMSCEGHHTVFRVGHRSNGLDVAGVCSSEVLQKERLFTKRGAWIPDMSLLRKGCECSLFLLLPPLCQPNALPPLPTPQPPPPCTQNVSTQIRTGDRGCVYGRSGWWVGWLVEEQEGVCMGGVL